MQGAGGAEEKQRQLRRRAGAVSASAAADTVVGGRNFIFCRKNRDKIVSWSSFESRLQRLILQKPLSDIIRKSVSDEAVLCCRSKTASWEPDAKKAKSRPARRALLVQIPGQAAAKSRSRLWFRLYIDPLHEAAAKKGTEEQGDLMLCHAIFIRLFPLPSERFLPLPYRSLAQGYPCPVPCRTSC